MSKSAFFCSVVGATMLSLTVLTVTTNAQEQVSSPPASVTVPAQPDGTTATLSNMRTGCRNARYGEVLIVKGPVLRLRANIYETLGLNDCPQDQWAKLDSDQIKKQEHALGVRLDGPRYFLMDSITVDQPGEMKTFSGLQMQMSAQIKLNPSTAREQLQAPPYAETNITKNPQYEFDKDKPMYELISPKGQVYVMQSCAAFVNPVIDEEALPKLGSRLKLPTGWQYRVVTPDKDIVIGTPGGAAHILQDDLQDTYDQLDASATSAS